MNKINSVTFDAYREGYGTTEVKTITGEYFNFEKMQILLHSDNNKQHQSVDGLCITGGAFKSNGTQHTFNAVHITHDEFRAAMKECLGPNASIPGDLDLTPIQRKNKAASSPNLK